MKSVAKTYSAGRTYCPHFQSGNTILVHSTRKHRVFIVPMSPYQFLPHPDNCRHNHGASFTSRVPLHLLDLLSHPSRSGTTTLLAVLSTEGQSSISRIQDQDIVDIQDSQLRKCRATRSGCVLRLSPRRRDQPVRPACFPFPVPRFQKIG